MAIKKKTTLIIDHQAEEQARQQALERELASDQPTSKVEKIKDNSVETNKAKLRRIKLGTTKSVLVVAGICALIGLLTWSVLQKARNDQQAAEQATRRKEIDAIVQKTDQALNGELDERQADRCQQQVSDYAKQVCYAQLRLTKVDQMLKDERLAKLPPAKRSELLQAKIDATLTIERGSKDYATKLDQLATQLKKHNADYYEYQSLAIEYVKYDRKKAIELFTIAKQKHAATLKANPTEDVDPYDFPVNEQELTIIYGPAERQ